MAGNAYSWRDANPDDLAGLASLDEVCFNADGPELVNWAHYQDDIASPDRVVRCAVTPADEIVAVTWARMSSSPAMLGGKTHPSHRRQGLGLQAVEQAEAAVAKRSGTTDMVIRNETLTEGAEALYRAAGYATDFIEYWMNRPLDTPMPDLPAEVRIETWTDANKRVFYDTFIDSFQDRGGPRESAEVWISWNEDDEDFRPDLCMLAYVDNNPTAFVTGGTILPTRYDAPIGWIGQIGVRPSYRGRGIVDGLMGEVARRVQSEGITTLGLDVNLNNPRAIRAYERNGFKPVTRRAKFSKTLS